MLMQKAMKKHNMSVKLFDLKQVFGIITLFVGLMVACSAIYSFVILRCCILAACLFIVFLKRAWIKEKVDFIRGTRA